MDEPEKCVECDADDAPGFYRLAQDELHPTCEEHGLCGTPHVSPDGMREWIE